MKYFISVSNGILDPIHRKRMGSAVWEFLWCLDRMTRIDKDGIGLVLGGKPVNLKEFSVPLGSSQVTVSRNLQKLAGHGYLILVHAPYGIVIKVPKAQKRFNRKANPQDIHRIGKNDKASFNSFANPQYRNDKPPFILDKPNKTVSVDKIADRCVKMGNPKVAAIKEEITKLVSTFTR